MSREWEASKDRNDIEKNSRREGEYNGITAELLVPECQACTYLVLSEKASGFVFHVRLGQLIGSNREEGAGVTNHFHTKVALEHKLVQGGLTHFRGVFGKGSIRRVRSRRSRKFGTAATGAAVFIAARSLLLLVFFWIVRRRLIVVILVAKAHIGIKRRWYLVHETIQGTRGGRQVGQRRGRGGGGGARGARHDEGRLCLGGSYGRE